MKKCTKCSKTLSLEEFYKHPETLDGRGSQCKNCQKQTSRKWQLDYHDRYNEISRLVASKRNAIKKGGVKSRDKKITVELLNLKMSYYGNKCYLCGGKFEHIDHVKPLSKGGLHILANLRPSCAKCNLSKGNRWPVAL